MKIREIHLGKVSIPLKKPFKTALREVYSAEDLIIKVIADSGEVGFGNSPPTVVITGDSQESALVAIRDTLGPRLIGMDVENREGIARLLDTGMVHNTSPKAALDIAVHDLFGQRLHFGLGQVDGCAYGIPLPIVLDRGECYVFRHDQAAASVNRKPAAGPANTGW